MDKLPETVDRVVAHTKTIDVEEDWQRAIAVDGLLAVDRGLAWVKRVVDRTIATQIGAGQFAYGWTNYPEAWADWTAYDVETYEPTMNAAALSSGALELYDRTGDRRYLDAVQSSNDFSDGGRSDGRRRPQPAPRVRRTLDGDAVVRLPVRGPPWRHHRRRDAGRSRRRSGDGPSKVPSGRANLPVSAHLAGDARPVPGECLLVAGNGWAVAGLFDTLEWLPSGHPARGQLETALADALNEIRPLQDESGFWHHILDDSTAPLECSGTLTFAYAFERPVATGVVDDDGFRDAAERDGGGDHPLPMTMAPWVGSPSLRQAHARRLA